jgi:Mor family transcriptional regulator
LSIGDNTQSFLEDLEMRLKHTLLLRLSQRLPKAEAGKLASAAAREAVNQICRDYGGSLVYIKKGGYRRDAMIRDDFRGRNHTELARKYGLSEPAVYKILKREKDARSRQLILPNLDSILGGLNR